MLRAQGVELLGVAAAQPAEFWRELLAALAARDITSVLIEGGAQVYAGALAADAVDKLSLYIAPLLIGGAALSAFAALSASRPPREPPIAADRRRPAGERLSPRSLCPGASAPDPIAPDPLAPDPSIQEQR